MFTIEYFKDKKNEWRWRMTHENGNIMADSGEGYVNKADAIQAIGSISLAFREGTITAINAGGETK